METKHEDSQSTLTLLAIGIGAVVTVSMSSGMSGPWDCIVGIILIVFLFKYTTESTRKEHDIVFGLIFGFCILMIIGFLVDAFYTIAIMPLMVCWSRMSNELFGYDKPLSIRDSFHLGVWMAGSYIGWRLARRAHPPDQEAGSSQPPSSES